MEVGGTVVDSLSATWNLSTHALPPQAQDSAPSTTMFGGEQHVVSIGRVSYVADLVVTTAANARAWGRLHLMQDDYLLVTYAIKYTGDLPDTSQAIVLARRKSDGVAEILNESKGSLDPVAI